jgi:predicted DNA-binding transcriptional regulator AlpA
MQSENRILRLREAWQTLGIGRTNFFDNYLYREGGDETVPGTNVRRLRPVSLGPRALGIFFDELQATIEALRHHRDGGAS